jgi:cytochrome c551/c552
LSAKILSGGVGVWGSVPMPAQSQLSKENAALMAKWIADGAQ